MKKRGLQLTFELILILILTVVAVVILGVFFSKTSGNFMGRIGNYFTYDNVDSVINGCNVLVSGGSEYSYCCDVKEVKYYEKEGEKRVKKQGDFTCNELVDKVFINGRINQMNCGDIGC